MQYVIIQMSATLRVPSLLCSEQDPNSIDDKSKSNIKKNFYRDLLKNEPPIAYEGSWYSLPETSANPQYKDGWISKGRCIF